jgi:hypothetical protein
MLSGAKWFSVVMQLMNGRTSKVSKRGCTNLWIAIGLLESRESRFYIRTIRKP